MTVMIIYSCPNIDNIFIPLLCSMAVRTFSLQTLSWLMIARASIKLAKKNVLSVFDSKISAKSFNRFP